MDVTIRRAGIDDADQIAEIYRPYVETTAISFEVDPPSVQEMARRVEAGSSYPWYVAEVGDQITAYAYASKHRERAAYQWSADVTVYSRPGDGRRRGVGRRLYERVLGDLRGLGYVNAFAGIALPNEASVGFHEAMGFEPVGMYRNAGFKLDRWHDVGWWQLQVVKEPGPLPPPRTSPAVE